MAFDRPPEPEFDATREAVARGLWTTATDGSVTGEARPVSVTAKTAELLARLERDSSLAPALAVLAEATRREQATYLARQLRQGELRAAIYHEVSQYRTLTSGFQGWLQQMARLGQLLSDPDLDKLLADVRRCDADLASTAERLLDDVPLELQQLAAALIDCLAYQPLDVLEAQLRWLGRVKRLFEVLVMALASDWRDHAETYAAGETVELVLAELFNESSVRSTLHTQLQKLLAEVACARVQETLVELAARPVQEAYDRMIERLNGYRGEVHFLYNRIQRGLGMSALAAKLAMVVGVFELVEQAVESARRSPLTITAALADQHQSVVQQAATARPAQDPVEKVHDATSTATGSAAAGAIVSP